MTEQRQVDVVVVGAGFAGLYLLHRLRGLGFSTQVVEAGGGVGGTWYWNRYPGARCDVESLEYSYGFDEDLQQEWEWSERYATQPEILGYLEHVADRFDLRRDIRFDTKVMAATFDDDTSRGTVRTDAGDELVAQFVVMATGCLSSANVPDIPGRERFVGPTYHTGRWPHEGVDFSGQRVGVIGTGSSAIQSIPIIAEQAADLTVFERTASYAVPAHNRPLDPAEQAEVKADYAGLRAANRQSMVGFGARRPGNEAFASACTPDERVREFEDRWAHGGLPFLGAFGDLMIDPSANEMASEFVRDKIREIVDDPATAKLLSPDTVIGCKRLCVDTGYYATFNRPNVALVDVSDHGVDEITEQGIRVDDTTYELDAIVFATGFDAMTGALAAIDICGRDGEPLRDAWAAGPRTYLGLTVAGFPNLFLVTGPGSPSVLTNMVTSIEHHVQFISEAIDHLQRNGLDRIEPTVEAQDDWVDFVNMVAALTVYPSCNSWYLGANVPGKPRVFMPLIGFPHYVERCDAIVAAGYEGFRVLSDLLDGPVEVVGALDLDHTATGIVPRRLPAWTRSRIPDLFMDFIVQSPSGVRLRFRTDSSSVELDALVTMLHYERDPFRGTAFDLTVDGVLVATVPTTVGTIVHIDRRDALAIRFEPGEATTIRFDGLAPGDKTVELWLPQDSTVELRDLRVDDGASIDAAPDARPTWLHYGSSISHCIEADSPTGTWPAIVASLADVRLISLGFGGQCLLDGFVARTIRDHPADLISVKVGINIVNTDGYRERTFTPALHAFLDTVRDGHPTTPILLVSPIFCPAVEDHPGPTVVAADGRCTNVPGLDELRATCLTLTKIRAAITALVDQRRALGDDHLHYLSGLELFDENDAGDLPDDLHPNAAGYRRIGERFAAHAFTDGGPLRPSHR